MEEYSFQLNERCHDLAGSLAEADLSSVIELAQEMAPCADPLKTRILARRLLEVQLIASNVTPLCTTGARSQQQCFMAGSPARKS